MPKNGRFPPPPTKFGATPAQPRAAGARSGRSVPPPPTTYGPSSVLRATAVQMRCPHAAPPPTAYGIVAVPGPGAARQVVQRAEERPGSPNTRDAEDIALSRGRWASRNTIGVFETGSGRTFATQRMFSEVSDQANRMGITELVYSDTREQQYNAHAEMVLLSSCLANGEDPSEVLNVSASQPICVYCQKTLEYSGATIQNKEQKCDGHKTKNWANPYYMLYLETEDRKYLTHLRNLEKLGVPYYRSNGKNYFEI